MYKKKKRKKNGIKFFLNHCCEVLIIMNIMPMERIFSFIHCITKF